MSYVVAGKGMMFVLTVSGGDTPMSDFAGEFHGFVDKVTLHLDHSEFPSIEFSGRVTEQKLGSPLKENNRGPIRVIRIGNPKKA